MSGYLPTNSHTNMRPYIRSPTNSARPVLPNRPLAGATYATGNVDVSRVQRTASTQSFDQYSTFHNGSTSLHVSRVDTNLYRSSFMSKPPSRDNSLEEKVVIQSMRATAPLGSYFTDFTNKGDNKKHQFYPIVQMPLHTKVNGDESENPIKLVSKMYDNIPSRKQRNPPATTKPIVEKDFLLTPQKVVQKEELTIRQEETEYRVIPEKPSEELTQSQQQLPQKPKIEPTLEDILGMVNLANTRIELLVLENRSLVAQVKDYKALLDKRDTDYLEMKKDIKEILNELKKPDTKKSIWESEYQTHPGVTDRLGENDSIDWQQNPENYTNLDLKELMGVIEKQRTMIDGMMKQSRQPSRSGTLGLSEDNDATKSPQEVNIKQSLESRTRRVAILDQITVDDYSQSKKRHDNGFMKTSNKYIVADSSDDSDKNFQPTIMGNNSKLNSGKKKTSQTSRDV